MIPVVVRERLLNLLVLKRGRYEQLLKRACLPTLKNRRLQDICTLMYKAKHKLCSDAISNLFNLHNSSYILRNPEFSTPRFNTVKVW